MKVLEESGPTAGKECFFILDWRPIWGRMCRGSASKTAILRSLVEA